MKKNNKIQKFIKSVRVKFKSICRDSKEYSYNEYFCMAAHEGLKALKEGNYGIGAIYIYRNNGIEYIVSGHNRMLSKNNTGLHAEEDTINAYENIASGKKKYTERIILIRKAQTNKTEKILVTSLEPCIGCVQRILSHKFNEVWIGAADPPSGAMLAGREKGLPQIWRDVRKEQGLKVKSNFKIDPKLHQILWDVFAFNRDYFDKLMAKQGLARLINFEKNINKFKNRTRTF